MTRPQAEGSSARHHRPMRRSSSRYPTRMRSSRPLLPFYFHQQTDGSCRYEIHKQLPLRECPHGDTPLRTVERVSRPQTPKAHGRAAMDPLLDPQSQWRGASRRRLPIGIVDPDSLGQPSHQLAVFSKYFAHMTIETRGIAVRQHPRVEVKNVCGQRQLQPGGLRIESASEFGGCLKLYGFTQRHPLIIGKKRRRGKPTTR